MPQGPDGSVRKSGASPRRKTPVEPGGLYIRAENLQCTPRPRPKGVSVLSWCQPPGQSAGLRAGVLSLFRKKMGTQTIVTAAPIAQRGARPGGQTLIIRVSNGGGELGKSDRMGAGRPPKPSGALPATVPQPGRSPHRPASMRTSAPATPPRSTSSLRCLSTAPALGWERRCLGPGTIRTILKGWLARG